MATTLGPLQVAVTDLRNRPGTRRKVERSFALEGVSTSTASVPAGAGVRVSLELEAVAGGVGPVPIVAEGTVSAGWTGSCRRCLEPVEGTAEVEVREIFEEKPTEGDTYPLRDDIVDLEPMVRDAIFLALPLAPLCRPDCPGPAPDSFPTGPALSQEISPNGDGDDRQPSSGDPRWSALDDLNFD